MKERDANRRYFLELSSALVVYAAVLCGSLYVGESMEPGPLRSLLLAAPVIPVFLAVWAVARHFARLDEFVRLRTLESLAIAAAVTAGVTLTYGFLENAGLPRLSMFWVWPVMGATWGLTSTCRGLLGR